MLHIKTIEAKVIYPKPKPRRWRRSQLREELQIPESTLKRYLTLLITHAQAEFNYRPYHNRVFDDFQIEAIRVIRDWHDEGMTREQIVEILENEGLPI